MTFPSVQYRKPFRPASLLLLAFLFLAGTTDALAQFERAGSVYSRFGIGELRSFHSSQMEAMGGGGVGISTSRYKTFANPAAWSNQVLTGVAGGLSYEGLQIDDGSSDVSTVGTGSLTSVQFGFPLTEQKLGVGLSFSPYSRVGYKIKVNDVIEGGLSPEDTSGYAITYFGNGGLHALTAGVGYAIGDRISVGVSGDFIFGLIEESRETEFDDTDFADTRLTNATRLTGLRTTFGLLGTLQDVATENDRLSAGLTFTLPATLTGDQTNLFGSKQDRDTLGTTTDAEVSIPLGLAGGAAYTFDSRWLMTIDAVYQPWTDFDSDVSLPGYTPENTSGLRDRLRLSAGVEVIPAGSDLFAGYFQRVAYRLGMFYDQSYISPSASNNVNSYGITSGLSLPLGVPGTRVDIVTSVGRRGSVGNGLVRDTFFKFGLNLNIGERWFVKRKLG